MTRVLEHPFTIVAGIAFVCAVIFGFFSPNMVHAQSDSGLVFGGGVSETCQENGNCSLDDIMAVFVNISNFILSIVGSLVLLIFIYGGFLWLTSGGVQERVQKGRKAMTGAGIGLLIVFGAYAGINFLTGALRGGTSGQENKCELVGPENGGKAGLGYACVDTGEIDTDQYDCETDLCPGAKSIQCCKLKQSSSE